MATFRLRNFVRYPRDIIRFHDRLRDAETWTPERRRAETQVRLERLLHHAVTNVPYYRETLAPFRASFPAMIDRLDLSELPVLTKDTVRAQGRALWADNHADYRPSVGTTSGTTGSPMAFALGRDSHTAHFASIWQMLNWTGYRFGDRFADLTGLELRNNAVHQMDRRLNCLRLCSYHLSRDTVTAFNDCLAKFKPRILKAAPSALFIYARFLRDEGIKPHQPPVVLTCSETIHPHYRETFNAVFTGQHFDFYNQNERACLFATCEHGAYHIFEDYSFVELDGDGSGPASILATTFHNFAMPLIRFQTNDLAEPAKAKTCACGRAYRTVGRILGRAEDVVVTPDGRFCSYFECVLEDFPEIRFTQLYQEDPSALEVRLVTTDAFDRINIPPRMERSMRKWLGEEIRIDFAFPDSLKPGPTGKTPFIVSHPGRQLARSRANDQPLGAAREPQTSAASR